MQAHTDSTGREATAEEIFSLFEREYLQPSHLRYCNLEQHSSGETVSLALDLMLGEQSERIRGQGSGPVAAAVTALSERFALPIQVVDYHEHGLSGGGAAGDAVCYVEMKIDQRPPVFGVGRDKNIVAAAVRALINGLGRAVDVSRLCPREALQT